MFLLHPTKIMIQNQMIQLRDEIEWGYMIPYMITGFQNEHPREAMRLRKTEDKDKYAQFYAEMSEKRSK